MTDQESFMAAILERPDDDAPRLMYADWLTEHGDPRGEFIQVQCELVVVDAEVASLGPCFCGDSYDPTGCSRCRRGAELGLWKRASRLKAKERELLRRYWSDWVTRPDGHYSACGNRDAWDNSSIGPSDGHVVQTFRRGFVDEIGLDTETFLKHAGELFRSQPIQVVRLTDREPLQVRGKYVWYLQSLNDVFLDSHYIPQAISGYDGEPDWHSRHHSIPEAHAWLSGRCVEKARELAELPPLKGVTV